MRVAAILLAACLGLCACSPKPKLECSNQLAQSTTTDLVKAQLEKAVTEALKSNDGSSGVLSSKIRATIQQLVITLADIRTTKEDPNSTKRFCTANLRIRVPDDLLSDAEKARSAGKLSSVSALADEHGIERAADTFVSSFEYDVQPTDAGDKVYAATDDLGKVKTFYGELLGSSLLRSAIEQKTLEASQAVSQQQQQQQQQQAAAGEQRAADQAQATTENQLATQTIAAVWKSLPSESRVTLLEDQRNWIRKKTADCNVEAASSSVDTTEQETARLRCDTKANEARTEKLKEALSASTTPTE